MKTASKNYQAPLILEDFMLETEGSILSSSSVVKDDTEVVSTGQEYHEMDLSSGTLQHNWE